MLSMQTTLSLLVLVAVIFGGLSFYVWVCSKLGIDIFTRPIPTSPPAQTNLYKVYGPNYDAVADFFFQCLRPLAANYHLRRPQTVEDVFAADTVNRISRNHGRILLRFEVQRETPELLMEAGAKLVPQKEFDRDGFAERIRDNLTDILGNGYYFSGPVFVNEIPGNRIRVEVCGVDRRIEYPPVEVNL